MATCWACDETADADGQFCASCGATLTSEVAATPADLGRSARAPVSSTAHVTVDSSPRRWPVVAALAACVALVGMMFVGDDPAVPDAASETPVPAPPDTVGAPPTTVLRFQGATIARTGTPDKLELDSVVAAPNLEGISLIVIGTNSLVSIDPASGHAASVPVPKDFNLGPQALLPGGRNVIEANWVGIGASDDGTWDFRAPGLATRSDDGADVVVTCTDGLKWAGSSNVVLCLNRGEVALIDLDDNSRLVYEFSALFENRLVRGVDVYFDDGSFQPVTLVTDAWAGRWGPTE